MRLQLKRLLSLKWSPLATRTDPGTTWRVKVPTVMIIIIFLMYLIFQTLIVSKLTQIKVEHN